MSTILPLSLTFCIFVNDFIKTCLLHIFIFNREYSQICQSLYSLLIEKLFIDFNFEKFISNEATYLQIRKVLSKKDKFGRDIVKWQNPISQ